jgi:hypothetical protein
MEPLLIVLIPGFFGGLVLSWLIARKRSTTPPTFVPRRLAAPSPSLINMASIKIEGLGGLGMVAAVVAVAIADSRIRLAMIIALILGGGLALGLIAMRARTGGAASSGGPEDRSMLHLEKTESTKRTEFTTKKRGWLRSFVVNSVPSVVSVIHSPDKPEDTGRRARRIGISRIFSLVSVRHRGPVGVDRATVIEARRALGSV